MSYPLDDKRMTRKDDTIQHLDNQGLVKEANLVVLNTNSSSFGNSIPNYLLATKSRQPDGFLMMAF